MAWNPDFQFQPTKVDEYIRYDRSFIFGLPPDQQGSQSNTCGAMPFRGLTATNNWNERKVLRGEDWEWLASFAACRLYAPDWELFGYDDTDYSRPAIVRAASIPELSRYPKLKQKQDMFHCLQAMYPYYFTSYWLRDQLIASDVEPSTARIGTVLTSGIYERPDPLISLEPTPTLSMNEMMNMFEDCRKMFRTLVTVRGTYMRYLYIWGWHNGGNDYIANPLTDLRITDFDVPNTCRTGCGYELYVVLKCTLYDLGVETYKWVVVRVRTEDGLYTTEQEKLNYNIPTVTQPELQAITNSAFGILGWHPGSAWPRPNPNTSSKGFIEVFVDFFFACATPEYLLPTWTSD